MAENLGTDLGCLSHLLPHTDELVALHGERVKPDVGGRDAHIGELDNKKMDH